MRLICSRHAVQYFNLRMRTGMRARLARACGELPARDWSAVYRSRAAMLNIYSYRGLAIRHRALFAAATLSHGHTLHYIILLCIMSQFHSSRMQFIIKYVW